MNGTMVILGADGGIRKMELTKADGILPMLQEAVGGYVEVVPYFTGFPDETGALQPCVAMCNEEGKLRGLPINQAATELWHQQLRSNPPALGMPLAGAKLDVLVGNVLVIMGDDEFMAEL